VDGSHIKIALESNPLAELAFKPQAFALKVERLRGLRPAGKGYWRYAEISIGEGPWAPAPDHKVHSAKLCTVEDATREIAARRKSAASAYKNRQHADALARRLTAVGVEAVAIGGRVCTTDFDALSRLLAKVGG